MWLWYLELYVFTLAAFALGAGLGLLLVRLTVRRTADDPSLVSEPDPRPVEQPEQAGATP
jgi:hypothetical protein